MAPRRIFISHSAREDPTANGVRQAIKDRLLAEGGYAVLMDDFALRAGDAWRSRINLWLGACDAAIVVLSEDALESSYVAFELNILGYRRWQEQRNGREFRIIPVLVEMTMERVNESPLAPSQAGEWNAVVDTRDPGYLDAIVQVMQEVVPFGTYPIERRARALMRSLPKDDDALDVAADTLGVELPFDIGTDKRVRLAHRLLHEGMSVDAARAIRPIRPKVDLPLAIELLSCAWVDLKAEDLPSVVLDEARKPVVLNASFTDTAKMYIGSARHLEKVPLPVHLAEPNTIIEERPDPAAHRQQVVDAVRQALFTELSVDSDAELSLALRDYHDLKEPVLVSLQAPKPDPETIAALRADFPFVTFFLLTGPEGDAGRLDPGTVYVIRPPLGKEDEAACRKQYDEFCRHLRRR